MRKIINNVDKIFNEDHLMKLKSMNKIWSNVKYIYLSSKENDRSNF